MIKRKEKKEISEDWWFVLIILFGVILTSVAIRIDYTTKKKLCMAKADLYGSKHAIFNHIKGYCLIEIRGLIIDINI